MKIYTKTGDSGETGLWGGSRVSKADSRVVAYGDVDELSSALGVALAALAPRPDAAGVRATLERVQKELFAIGALLASPKPQLKKLAPPYDAGMPADAPSRLEAEIDRLDAELRPMTRFILPGGSEAGARLHLARAVCRRAERAVAALPAKAAAPGGVIPYLNRLSDYLFTAARWVNARDGRAEAEWDGLPKR